MLIVVILFRILSFRVVGRGVVFGFMGFMEGVGVYFFYFCFVVFIYYYIFVFYRVFIIGYFERYRFEVVFVVC